MSSTPRIRDCRFSSVSPVGWPGSNGSSVVARARWAGLDGRRGHVDPEIGGQRHRVGHRSLARVAGRHRHPVDVLPAQGIDGDGRHQGRVDAAGQPDHRVGEPVLAHVVAGAEDQRLVDLGLGVEGGGHRSGDGAPGGRREPAVTRTPGAAAGAAASSRAALARVRAAPTSTSTSTSASITSSTNWAAEATTCPRAP